MEVARKHLSVSGPSHLVSADLSCSYSPVLMSPDITIQNSKGDICGNRFFMLFGVKTGWKASLASWGQGGASNLDLEEDVSGTTASGGLGKQAKLE